MRSFYHLMGVPPTGFDPEHRFVTSWVLSPALLAAVRLLLSLYCFATNFVNWGWSGSHQDAKAIGQSFSYFTVLAYWGLAFYMLTSSIHGFVYVKHGQSWLDRWPRPMQLLHSLFYTTIVTFPFLVTLVYWLVLFNGIWYPLLFDAWSNVSRHGLNSLFALVEVVLPATNPPPWLHLPFLWVILLLYLALAYLTHYTQGWYPYTFLDPAGGHSVRVLIYVLGILAASIVIFVFVWLAIWVRRRFSRPGKKSKRDVGPEYRYVYARQHDIELK